MHLLKSNCHSYSFCKGQKHMKHLLKYLLLCRAKQSHIDLKQNKSERGTVGELAF